MNSRVLNNIISEEISRCAIRKQVRAIVSEEVNRYINSLLREDEEKSEKKKGSKVTDSMKAEVSAWLAGKSGDVLLYSQLAYMLFPSSTDEEKAAARSLFSKKVKGTRPWNDEETLKLYQAKNSI